MNSRAALREAMEVNGGVEAWPGDLVRWVAPSGRPGSRSRQRQNHSGAVLGSG